MYNGSYLYFPFFIYELGKRKRKTNLPFSIFYYGIEKRKTKGRYIQHSVLFRFSFFPSCKRKNENMYNGSYFYFSFFVCGLRKKKRILRYPFPIFYHEIEKRKTKGRYIHGPRRFCFSGFLFLQRFAKKQNRYNKSYFYFPFCLWIRKMGKGKLVTPFLFSIMEKWKNGIYSTWCISVCPFSSCKINNEICVTGHISIFGSFLCGLGKRKTHT